MRAHVGPDAFGVLSEYDSDIESNRGKISRMFVLFTVDVFTLIVEVGRTYLAGASFNGVS